MKQSSIIVGATTRRGLTGADWFNLASGIWLIISPFVLGFERNTAALWSNVAMGAAIIVLAVLTGLGTESIEGVTVPLGVWLFFSPFVLGPLNNAFLANNVVMAFVVIAGGASGEAFRQGKR